MSFLELEVLWLGGNVGWFFIGYYLGPVRASSLASVSLVLNLLLVRASSVVLQSQSFVCAHVETGSYGVRYMREVSSHVSCSMYVCSLLSCFIPHCQGSRLLLFWSISAHTQTPSRV
jgi:hypothetical protein